MTPRELVKSTLAFNNTTGKAPQQLWDLPWANNHHGAFLQKIRTDFPDDITYVPVHFADPPHTNGNAWIPGEFTDEWGCVFTNIHEGIIGQVKEPLIKEDDWSDAGNVRFPEELLSFDIQQVNEFCKNTDRFTLASATPRPFEQLQFIRSTELLYMDLVYPSSEMLAFFEKLHDYYCRMLRKWAQTDVDALMFMDDWGSQKSLLINPKLWTQLFKPMYKDFIDIAHRHGKKAFMHSDGYILDIYPHFIDLGLDALNSQIFCMGIDNLEQFKGRITFWGEMDRQHLLVEGSIADIDRAVKQVREKLWINGGCIAQCEFGPGAKPENVYQYFRSWKDI